MSFFEYISAAMDVALYALIAGVLLSVSSSLLGVSLVLKKYSMIGDGLSHVAFAALAVAVATHTAPLLFSLPIVTLTAFLLLRISERSRIKGDAAIAVVSTASLAVGAIAVRGTGIELEGYMFGSIVAISLQDVVITAVITFITVGVYVLFYNRIFAVTFDETNVKAGGGHPAVYNALIAILTAVTVVMGMRLVGALLISALIIFPALSAMRFAKSYLSVVVVSAVIAISSFLVSLAVSLFLDIPTGACVVLLDLIIFGVATLCSVFKVRRV